MTACDLPQATTADSNEWEEDVSSYLLLVRQYDSNDIPIGTQRLLLMVDESLDDGFIASNVSTPIA